MCLCEAVIESYSCMADSVSHSNHYTRIFSVHLCEDVIESSSCTGDSVSHSNHYTRLYSVLMWGCNWITIHAWVILSVTLTIRLDLFSVLVVRLLIESHLMRMGDSVSNSNHYTRMYYVLMWGSLIESAFMHGWWWRVWATLTKYV